MKAFGYVVAVGIGDMVIGVFLGSGLLRARRLGRRVLRLGAAEGGDTSHILGSFMKLCRYAGDLRAGHALRESQPARTREG